MKRLALASLVVLVAASWARVAVEPKSDAKKTELNGHSFTLPPGFEIELVAGPPLVERPIAAAFDEEGHLYVTEAPGSFLGKPDIAQQKKLFRVLRLEDTKGTGRFDKRTVFVESVVFPEGAMWYDGSLYVAAPPSIWKFTDTKGTGVADQQVEWFQGKTLTGCANDLHGSYLGPDGWIYWCKGAFAQQKYERHGKAPFVTRAAHIFRSRPDGSGLEPVMTGGMDNPVGVAFTPGGERIFTTTFLQHPAAGKRDGLIHAIYGGVYGKDHDVVYDHPWTAPTLMPVLTHLGPSAPCGLTRYESKVFGADYQDNLFACQFNMHKVSRHVLTPDGATFKTQDTDFVVSDNHDFHPTDVLEDADGSLLVVDTGGWYKLCCPSSQLQKPEVTGGIYRVRKKGAPRVDNPRGLKLAWDKLSSKELTALLDDARPAVRRRAMEALAKKGADAVPALAETINKGATADARRNAVWTATRIEQPEAYAAVRGALADTDETVRQAAIHSVSVRRDGKAVEALLKLLHSLSQHNQRAAAEALGRIGDKAAVVPLLEKLGHPSERALEHSLTYALIEIADSKQTAAGLKSDNRLVRRAALIALDQMPGGGLDLKEVMRDVNSTTPALKETAVWIIGRHSEWSGDLVGYIKERLNALDVTDAEHDEIVCLLARFARAKPMQDLLAERVRSYTASARSRRMALRAMGQAGLKEAPPSWLEALADALESKDEELLREAAATVRQVALPKQPPRDITAALLRAGDNGKLSEATRLQALAAVPGGLSDVKPEGFAFLVKSIDKEQPVATRALAADVLSQAKLHREQLLALADALKNVGPMEIDRVLQAFAQSTDERVGLRLVAALDASPIRGSLAVGTIKPRLAKYNDAVQRKAEELYAALDAESAKQKEHLEKLLASLEKGDVTRGQKVFNSQKAACLSCHTVGYVGGKVGPDLTRIGAIRTERDLLDSIVYPSSSFVRGYEPVQVTTKRGKTYNGVLRKDAPDEIVLALDATNEVRIARDEIDELVPGKVSIMPAGLDKQLSPRDLADLLAFLKACK
jgi:putative membrane-bound dehydrogenase-like protein